MRVWHSPWSWLKLIVAAESVAGNTRTGTLTRLILRKPFQVGLAAMGGLSAISPAEVREPAGAEVGGWGWRRVSGWLRRLRITCASLATTPKPTSNSQPPTSAQVSSELKADLKLKHSRRIDVRQARERVGRRPRGDHLPERRVHDRGVAEGRLRAPEDVPVVEQVEAFQPEQDRPPGGLDPPLDEEPDVLGPGAEQRRLG